ncbi:hypothetical protein AAFF_G00005350 [Aldrovandia affinis]|uniref:Ankyrin repeat domain-containing protein 24 n=1 Tax=Aldrovandia affinis TaxID=143900 RepID=A0AAD7X2X7_9TELE|nr:hypothetical protein AAFF_G00005350 [Aldrovandia affinis]
MTREGIPPTKKRFRVESHQGSTMKSLKAKFKKSESQDWSKSDERLLQAVEQNEPDKVTALLAKKGLCASKLDADGKSAFHVCVTRGRVDCLEAILSHGVDINATDGTGFSALHLAAKNGQPECVKRLLQESVPVDSPDSFGRTALHHAAVSGCVCSTEILWDFKACLDSQDGDGSTPLLLAAQMSHVEVLNFLLDRRANANLQDGQGRTALMLACESDSVETVELLLRGRADTHLTDSLGHNAAHYSVTAGNEQLTQLLQSVARGTGKLGEALVFPHSPVAQAQRLYKTVLLTVWLLENKNTATFRVHKPPAPPPLPGGATPRKRKAPLPPNSPSQVEDEEVFEEIRRLRLERGRLLQKIKALEQQQHTAHTALEELCALRNRLEHAEAERDRLNTEVEELRSQQGEEVFSDSEVTEDILDFPGAERLLSRQSRGTGPQSPSAQEDCTSPGDPDSLCTSQSQGDPESVFTYQSQGDLQMQVEELTAANADLVLKIQCGAVAPRRAGRSLRSCLPPERKTGTPVSQDLGRDAGDV